MTQIPAPPSLSDPCTAGWPLSGAGAAHSTADAPSARAGGGPAGGGALCGAGGGAPSGRGAGGGAPAATDPVSPHESGTTTTTRDTVNLRDQHSRPVGYSEIEHNRIDGRIMAYCGVVFSL